MWKERTADQIEKQHRAGKLHAIERILLLLDPDSFQEIGSGIRNQTSGFGLEKGSVPYDGVITGSGTIQGRKVVVYAQDFTVSGGTLGNRHGKKIARALQMAVENRCPIIGINDSGGARIQEGVEALAGYGEIFYWNTIASGYIPQISIIAGNCAGGAAYSPGITDFVFMLENTGKMYITGPRVVAAAVHQQVSQEFGSARMHGRKSGAVHFICRDEEDCCRQVKKLLSLIPHCCGEKPQYTPVRGCMEKALSKAGKMILSDRRKVYDIRRLIHAIADTDSFFEVQKEFAENLVAGFFRLDGRTTGVLANQPLCKGGILDVDSSDKGARFIRYCDAFDIPVLTLVDVPGFLPGTEQEELGLIRHGAKLLYAYSESTAAKVTVILRRAYGGAYIAMGSRHVGADFVYAWPGAEIAVMGEESAAEVLFRRELEKLSGEERNQRIGQIAAEYRKEVMNSDIAVSAGYVDEVITPEETRERLRRDFAFLKDKKVFCPVQKKHGNIPL